MDYRVEGSKYKAGFLSFPPLESVVSFNPKREKITGAVNQKSVLLQFHSDILYIYCASRYS